MLAQESLLSWAGTHLIHPSTLMSPLQLSSALARLLLRASGAQALLAELGCAFPLLCTLSAFQPRNPRASLKSMRWEITSLSPFPFGAGVHRCSSPRRGQALKVEQEVFAFPRMVPSQLAHPRPPPAHRDPCTPCCCFLLRLKPSQVQTAQHPSQVVLSVLELTVQPHVHTQGGCWKKGQKQAALDLAEIHLAFNFLTGSNFG